jgi:hypothetical protein
LSPGRDLALVRAACGFELPDAVLATPHLSPHRPDRLRQMIQLRHRLHWVFADDEVGLV